MIEDPTLIPIQRFSLLCLAVPSTKVVRSEKYISFPFSSVIYQRSLCFPLEKNCFSKRKKINRAGLIKATRSCRRQLSWKKKYKKNCSAQSSLSGRLSPTNFLLLKEVRMTSPIKTETTHLHSAFSSALSS